MGNKLAENQSEYNFIIENSSLQLMFQGFEHQTKPPRVKVQVFCREADIFSDGKPCLARCVAVSLDFGRIAGGPELGRACRFIQI